MPEICELRTDADQLDFFLCNRTLTGIVAISKEFAKKTTGLEDLTKSLPLNIEWVRSRAKKLFIKFFPKDGKTWHIYVTYGMTGGMSAILDKHSHIEFTLSEHWVGLNTFYYQDVRRFGSFIASSDEKVYREQVSQMAKPFVLGYDDPDFMPITESEFSEKLVSKGRRKYLISALMDQHCIGSGLGNYLVSECFYEAKLDPWIHCHTLALNKGKVSELFRAISKVVSTSYRHGGNSISDYLHIDGSSGLFSEHIQVYGRDGEMDKYGRKILSKRGPHGRTVFFVQEHIQ